MTPLVPTPSRTAAEKDALRGDIERTHANNRDAIQKQYSQDKKELEDAFLAELRASDQARREALVAAGLNPNGSDPQGRN